MLSIAFDRLRKLVRIAVFTFLPTTPLAQAEGRSAPDPYPLTAAQTLDTGNLQVTFRSDEVRPSRTHPGKKVRAVNLRYFSHAWKDGPWFGNTIVLLPEPMPKDWGGQAAMCSPWPVKTEAGVDLIEQFMEHTALEFGIPVATCPDPGEHYGLSQIHQLSDHLMFQYFKTGDVTWLPEYPYAVLRARALTAIGQLTKTPVRAAVHMGSSITAHHAWVWPKYDPRVRGLITSGDIGYFRDMYPLGGECRGPREITKAFCRAEPAIREVFLRHVDPYEFADVVRCPVLAVLGSNDFACPPLTVPRFLARLPGPTHLIQVPNHQHGNDSRQHIEGFRMWIDHLFSQRPLTSVAVEAMEYRSGRIRGTAGISGKTRLDSVQLFCLSTGEPKYFRSRRFLDAPDDSYSLLKAVWHAVPMKRDGQRWSVDAEVPGTKNRFAACFVAVTDFAGRTRGYASSPTLWLEDSSFSSTKPASASPPILDTPPSAGSSPDPVKRGGRILGFSVNESADRNFDAAFRTARAAGMQAVSLVLNWDDTEKTPGRFESPWPKTANVFYGGNKMPVSLRLATFDTNNNRFPADLRGKSLDAPEVIARFNAFADWVLDQMPDVELADLSIGNEVNASLGTDAQKWRQYTAFFKATREHVRGKRPGLKVGSNIMFSAHTGRAQKYLAELNQSADVVMVSYYPLDNAFHVRSPTDVRGDFARVCAAYSGREIRFTEVGYPSGEDCGSTLEKQRQFVEEVFTAWDAHAEQVKMVLFVWLHDISPESVDRYRTYYGISDRAFLAYLGTLGLRTYAGSGTDKPAFAALKSQAKARDW